MVEQPVDVPRDLGEAGPDLTSLPQPSEMVVDVTPTGYHLLIEIPRRSDKTSTGIFRPDEYRHKEEVASVLAYVVEVGPDAFQDRDHFPSGKAWCSPGDWILIHPYSGSRFQIRRPDGQFGEYRILEDRHVLAVVSAGFAPLVDRINAA